MKLGIMQPYFFPYIGYFSLIANTDRFVVFDPVQFIHHGWIERNRILKPSDGWQYIAVPLEKHHRNTIIQDIRINHATDWREKIVRQLDHYRKKAPYYRETMDVVRCAWDVETDSITYLNTNILRVVSRYLGISTPIEIFSEMDLTMGEVTAPDEWALQICLAIPGADAYLNPEGGLSFFDREKYLRSGIQIAFQKMNLPVYSQRRAEFESGLSIIDVMMYNSPEEIRKMLGDFELL